MHASAMLEYQPCRVVRVVAGHVRHSESGSEEGWSPTKRCLFRPVDQVEKKILSACRCIVVYVEDKAMYNRKNSGELK